MTKTVKRNRITMTFPDLPYEAFKTLALSMGTKSPANFMEKLVMQYAMDVVRFNENMELADEKTRRYAVMAVGQDEVAGLKFFDRKVKL